jgi:hypothetical protein
VADAVAVAEVAVAEEGEGEAVREAVQPEQYRPYEQGYLAMLLP